MRVVMMQVATLVASIAVARDAFADEPLALTWSAPAGCPDERAVRADVASRITHARQPVAAIANVSSDGGKWRVVLETTQAGENGKREIAGRSCREVAAATALVLALMIDPPDALAPPPPPPPPPTPPITARRAPAKRRAAEPIRLAVSLALDLGFFGLPRTTVGLEARLLARVRRVSFGLRATATDVVTIRANRGSADFSAVSAGPVLGVDLAALEGFRVSMSAGLVLYRIDASSRGLSENGVGRAQWLAPLASVEARARLVSPVWLTAGIDLVVATESTTFVVLGTNSTVFQPPPASLEVALGLEVDF